MFGKISRLLFGVLFCLSLVALVNMSAGAWIVFTGPTTLADKQVSLGTIAVFMGIVWFLATLTLGSAFRHRHRQMIAVLSVLEVIGAGATVHFMSRPGLLLLWDSSKWTPVLTSFLSAVVLAQIYVLWPRGSDSVQARKASA